RHHLDRAVLVDVDLGARFTARVEPEAAGNPAPLIGPKGCLVVRMTKCGLKRLLIADPGERGTVGCFRSLFGGILLTQKERIDPQGAGELIESGLNRKCPDRCARR